MGSLPPRPPKGGGAANEGQVALGPRGQGAGPNCRRAGWGRGLAGGAALAGAQPRKHSRASAPSGQKRPAAAAVTATAAASTSIVMPVSACSLPPRADPDPRLAPRLHRPSIGHTSVFKCSGRSRSFFACLLNSSPSTSSFCDPPENPIRKGFYVGVKPQSIGAVRPPVVTSPTRPCIDGETETQGRAESPSSPRERVASWNWDF